MVRRLQRETLCVVRPYGMEREHDDSPGRRLPRKEAPAYMMTIIRRVVRVVLSWILKKI